MPIKQTKRGLCWFTDDFTGGYNQYIEPCRIKDNEFTEFRNLVSFRNGYVLNAIKRNGFTRHNSNALQSGSHDVLSVYEYIARSQAVNFQRLVCKTDNGLYYFAVGSDDYKSASSVAIIDASDGATKKVKMLCFGDCLYVVDRNDGTNQFPNKAYNGTSIADMGLPHFYNAQIDLEEISSTASLYLPTGCYSYLMTYILDNDQEVFPYLPNRDVAGEGSDWQSNQYNSAPSYETTVAILTSCKKINIPTLGAYSYVRISNTVPPNSRVKKRKLYRAMADGGSYAYYRLCTEILDNDVKYVYDWKSNAQLGDVLSLQFVPKTMMAKCSVVHQNRLFIGNLKEDYGTAPDVSAVAVTSGTGGHLTNDVVSNRCNHYFYKIAYLDIIPDYSLPVPSALIVIYGSPYAGSYSSFSSWFGESSTHETHNANTLTNLPNDDVYRGRIAVFRNICRFLYFDTDSLTVYGTTQIKVIVQGDNTAFYFPVGDKITFHNLTGDWNYLNYDPIYENTYEVVESHNGTGKNNYIIVEYGDLVPDKPHNGSGCINGGQFYLSGYTSVYGSTNSTQYVDIISDDQLLVARDILENNGIYQRIANYKYSSMVMWSEYSQGDVILGENFFNIEEDDNDEIVGLATDSNGVIVFKDRNIYKLYTPLNVEQWEYRKLIHGIGCSDRYSIVQIGMGEVVFYFNKSFYHWLDTSQSYPQECSLKIKSYLESITFTNLDVAYDNKRKWVIYTYDTSSIKGNCLVYDLSVRDERGQGIWYHFTKYETNLGLKSPCVTKEGSLLFGCYNDSRVYRYDGTIYKDVIQGTEKEIYILLQTKVLEDIYMQIKKMDLWTKSTRDENQNIDFYYLADDVSSTKQTFSITGGINRNTLSINCKAKEFYLKIENLSKYQIIFKKIGVLYIPEHYETITV